MWAIGVRVPALNRWHRPRGGRPPPAHRLRRRVRSHGASSRHVKGPSACQMTRVGWGSRYEARYEVCAPSRSHRQCRLWLD